MKHNRYGFTAIELVIGIGLVAILTTVVLTTQLMVTKEQVKLSTELGDSIDANLAERMIFKDLNNIDPSYNNLNIKDDSGLNFFDYFPDVPANSLINPVGREVILSLAGRTEFFILVQDQLAGPMMNYDPTAAYDVGTIPADFNKSADLQFQSLNKNSWVIQQRPNFWTDGRLLLLDTPVRVRPLDKARRVDLSIAPRSPVFVGAVAGEALMMDETVKNVLNVTDPETGDEISNPDVFLRRAPSQGGGQPLIRLRAVKLIRYYLVKMDEVRQAPSAANLYKRVYENGKWSEPFLMADKVEQFNLRRDSVLKRMIYFKLKKTKFQAAKAVGI